MGNRGRRHRRRRCSRRSSHIRRRRDVGRRTMRRRRRRRSRGRRGMGRSVSDAADGGSDGGLILARARGGGGRRRTAVLGRGRTLGCGRRRWRFGGCGVFGAAGVGIRDIEVGTASGPRLRRLRRRSPTAISHLFAPAASHSFLVRRNLRPAGVRDGRGISPQFDRELRRGVRGRCLSCQGGGCDAVGALLLLLLLMLLHLVG